MMMRSSLTAHHGRPPRLPELVADHIQESLVADRLVPGTRLPTEEQLAAEHDVSRTVIREATRLLEQRGLVDIRPGRGMVVAELDGSRVAAQYLLMLRRSPAVFAQLMELRLVVEVEMTGIAARERTDADLVAMSQVLERARASMQDFSACLAADLEFHALVARATGNLFVPMLIDPVNVCLRESYREPVAYLASQPRTLEEHARIYAAIERGDAEQARVAARVHLERVLAEAGELVPEKREDNP
jgi:GntR family transcriptional repressor for pyruvate dehydrogenase complex